MINAEVLTLEFAWLEAVIDTRLRLFMESECEFGSVQEVPVPDIQQRDSPYTELINELELGPAERLVLLIALAPHLKPELLDPFFTANPYYKKPFTEFGGAPSSTFQGFLPTGQTCLFLLAGDDLRSRIELKRLFDYDHPFAQLNILSLESGKAGEPFASGRLLISKEYLELLSSGNRWQPEFNAEFPAKKVTTNMAWEEVVLPSLTLESVREIQDWLTYGKQIAQLPGLNHKLKPGYKCLFYGPPGTGKTLTACLLGKASGKDVYRIDLSLVVSKYIGETEKNLSKIFDKATHQNWILFFDEADALFGKRTETRSANERYANQEVAYLLQRIEEFDGLVVLATNLKENIDGAFTRRFQSIIHFPAPNRLERRALWEKSFSPEIPPGDTVNLEQIAKKFETTGAQILNIIHYCTLQAVKRGDTSISAMELERGIKKELIKEGITLF